MQRNSEMEVCPITQAESAKFTVHPRYFKSLEISHHHSGSWYSGSPSLEWITVESYIKTWPVQHSHELSLTLHTNIYKQTKNIDKGCVLPKGTRNRALWSLKMVCGTTEQWQEKTFMSALHCTVYTITFSTQRHTLSTMCNLYCLHTTLLPEEEVFLAWRKVFYSVHFSLNVSTSHTRWRLLFFQFTGFHNNVHLPISLINIK